LKKLYYGSISSSEFSLFCFTLSFRIYGSIGNPQSVIISKTLSPNENLLFCIIYTTLDSYVVVYLCLMLLWFTERIRLFIRILSSLFYFMS
jgi:hypothetical protein